MSAERLRKAARLLRLRAERATALCPAPWDWESPEEVFDSHGLMVADTYGENRIGPYVATMHPGVGLAVAALLEAAADYTVPDPHDPACDCCPCCERDRNAVAVADAILGPQS